jgi:hypothetical protein
MTLPAVSDERFALRAALQVVSPQTYAGYGLGRFSPMTDNVALLAISCVETTDGRLEAVARGTAGDSLTIEAGVRLRWLEPRFGWGFTEYGRDLDVFEIRDGPLAGRRVEVAQAIGAFSAEQELVAWLVVPIEYPVSRQPNMRAAVLRIVSSLHPEVLRAENVMMTHAEAGSDSVRSQV